MLERTIMSMSNSEEVTFVCLKLIFLLNIRGVIIVKNLKYSVILSIPIF